MEDIKLISKLCNKYPQKLLNIKNSPDTIYAIGNLTLLNTFSLAVIGSRNFTSDAKILTENLVKDLVAQDICIISGMARGIDQIAHKTCISSGGKTIAILGSGFLHSMHKKIFREILENDGLIISEYSPETPPYKSNFPRRNELISALSSGVVITQAGENSGTLITAKHAFSQGKTIFTFPWNIDSEIYRGNNLLLTQGAKCILSYKDILKNYPHIKEKKILTSIIPDIPEEYIAIYKNLSLLPISINQLAQKTNIDFSTLQYKLTLMEVEGLITKHPHNSYTKNK